MRCAVTFVLACLVVSLGAPPRARAQDAGVPADGGTTTSPFCPATAVGCDARDLDWAWHAALFDAIDLDTGWVPAGSPLQLHFGLHLAGMTDVAMGGTVVTSWPTPLTIDIEGRPRTGRLSVDYGYVITAQLRFSLDVAGSHYAWTGDIPFPATVPRSISLMGTTVFDPFVLPTASPRPVLVTGSTTRFPVFRYDAIGGFVSVPGVTGGVAVDLQGAMTTSYQTDRIAVLSTTPITTEHGTTRLLPQGSDDYGPSVEVTAHPEGTVRHTGTILVYPNLYLDIAGRRFTYDLATVSLPIVDATSNAIFEDERAHVPLPDVGIVPTMLYFGSVDVGGTHEELLDLANLGEAALVVHARPLSGAFTAGADTLTIPPMGTDRLPLDFAPTAGGPAAATLLLETNDPDHPLLALSLRGDGVAPPPLPDLGPPAVDAAPPAPDAGVHSVAMGGCCRVGGAPSDRTPLALVALLLGVAVLRRRRS